MIDFHDPSYHENGFLGGYNRFFLTIENPLNSIISTIPSIFLRPQNHFFSAENCLQLIELLKYLDDKFAKLHQNDTKLLKNQRSPKLEPKKHIHP